MANSNNVKHLSGKLSDHFAFKVNAEENSKMAKLMKIFVVTTDYISQFDNLNFSMSND